MFVRLKKNRSGSVSVHVVEKSERSNRLIRSFGTSSDKEELRRLELEARMWIDDQKGPAIFDYDDVPVISNASDYDAIFESLDQQDLILAGPEMVYGRLFDKIGYNKVQTKDNELFRNLVVTRLYKPGSKLRTLQYIAYFMNKFYDSDYIYRYLDELCHRKDNGQSEEEREKSGVKWQVEHITYEQTKSVLGGNVSVVFYDTTTLYFESREDDLRVPGWSKDGKNSNPQVVLGLLVASGGNPIGYEIHKGNQYEGDTLIPIIKKLQKRFDFDKPIVIADAGLLNKTNIRSLEKDGYEYILGARIKTLKEDKKKEILNKKLKHSDITSIALESSRRMVVTMSDERAKKNAADREKGIRRLEKRFRTQNITKETINSRGYNKFLSIEGEAKVVIDYTKIEYDAKFDGLKGYVTNCHLPDKDIVENYRYLFMIERAFRMNKTDLDIRPMYHRLFNRIEAHICICFTAYTIMLEMERILKTARTSITLQRARFLVEKIYKLQYFNPFSRKKMSVIPKSENDFEVRELLTIIDAACAEQK